MNPADERPHRPPGSAGWCESWWFDFARADGSLGGFVRLVLVPRPTSDPGAASGPGTAWYWAALVGDGRPYLLVRDEDVPLPRSGATEVRAEGLWSSLECEDPFDHWTIGLEAFAVSLDQPDDAWHGERGDVVGLGFDLEWEATEPPSPFPPGRQAGTGTGNGNGNGYGQPCAVHGVILVGPTERLAFEGTGWRSHTWGDAAEPVPSWPDSLTGPTAPAGVPVEGPAPGSGAPVRQRAPLMAAGRPVEYVLVEAATSASGGGWRARGPGS